MKLVFLTVSIIICVSIGLIQCKLQQPYHDLQFKTSRDFSDKNALNNQKDNLSSRSEQDQNANDDDDDDDDRIIIAEPYKSLVQTTTRFAITNTKLSKHFNVDNIMNVLNSVGYLMARTSIIFAIAKAAAVSFVSIMVGLFFMPGALHYLDAAWRNPTKTLGLDKYMSNGLYEKSVLKALHDGTDQILNQVGFNDEKCRVKTFCHLGEMGKLMAPNKSRATVSFMRQYFANVKLPNDPHMNAYTTGLVDGSCQNYVTNTTSCLGNFMDSFMKSFLRLL